MPIYTGSTMNTDTTGGSTLVWPQWNRTYQITASQITGTNSYTSATDIWDEWVGMTASTITAATSNIVGTTGTATIGQFTNDWVFDTNGTYREAARIVMQRWAQQNEETKEQRAAREAAEAAAAVQREEARRLWEAAEPERAAARERNRLAHIAADAKRLAGHKRAMELLYLVLSVSQKAMLEANRFFYVDAPSGRRYRIDQGNHANVKVVDKVTGAILERLCVQPDGLPDGDVMLIQKLLIETAEQAFRDTANISAYGPGGENSSSKHLLTGEKLAEILQFPQGGRQAA